MVPFPADNQPLRSPAVRWFVSVAIAVALLFVGANGRADDVQTAKKHFLWKVESKTTTVYLLGSVHAAKKELYPLDDIITASFKKCDVLVLEIPMDDKSLKEAGFKLISAAKLPAGDAVEQHLDKETRKLYGEYVKKTKFPALLVRSYRPWFVALSITALEMQKFGYSEEHGIDRHFLKLAKKAGKPAEGIETLDEHIRALSTLPEKTQVLMLKETLEDVPNLKGELQKLFTLWKSGDPKKLDEAEFKRMRQKEYRPVYDNLIVKRNKAWMKKLDDYLKSGKRYFIVVGAGHLAGPDGLIELLAKEKKYKITQY